MLAMRPFGQKGTDTGRPRGECRGRPGRTSLIASVVPMYYHENTAYATDVPETPGYRLPVVLGGPSSSPLAASSFTGNNGTAYSFRIA